MRTPLRQLWPALETLPGLAAVAEEWKSRLGEDYEAGRGLLRVTNRRAEAYPCPSPGGIGCPRQILDHGNGRFVAVCGDQPKRCDRLVLTRQDIAIHALDTRRLCALVAGTFGIDPAFEEIEGVRQTWRAGDYHPRAGRRFPLFLAIQSDAASSRDVATQLCTATEAPFILTVPTVRFCDLSVVDLLRRQQSRLAALSDLFENDGAGELVATDAASAFLAEFHAAVMPAADEGQPNRLPTPPGTRWEDISIEFTAEEVATIRCRGSITRRVEPEHLDMKNLKNGRPTLQWTLLRSLARSNGAISWNDHDADVRIKQQKRQLSKKLIAYFGIEDAPIDWHYDHHEYRARFFVSNA